VAIKLSATAAKARIIRVSLFYKSKTRHANCWGQNSWNRILLCLKLLPTS
jgi:hypothetical protein